MRLEIKIWKKRIYSIIIEYIKKKKRGKEEEEEEEEEKKKNLRGWLRVRRCEPLINISSFSSSSYVMTSTTSDAALSLSLSPLSEQFSLPDMHACAVVRASKRNYRDMTIIDEYVAKTRFTYSSRTNWWIFEFKSHLHTLRFAR